MSNRLEKSHSAVHMEYPGTAELAAAAVHTEVESTGNYRIPPGYHADSGRRIKSKSMPSLGD